MKKLVLFLAGRIILENVIPIVDGLTELSLYKIKSTTLRLAKRNQRLENEIAGVVVEDEDPQNNIRVVGFEVPQEDCYD